MRVFGPIAAAICLLNYCLGSEIQRAPLDNMRNPSAAPLDLETEWIERTLSLVKEYSSRPAANDMLDVEDLEWMKMWPRERRERKYIDDIPQEMQSVNYQMIRNKKAVQALSDLGASAEVFSALYSRKILSHVFYHYNLVSTLIIENKLDLSELTNMGIEELYSFLTTSSIDLLLKSGVSQEVIEDLLQNKFKNVLESTVDDQLSFLDTIIPMLSMQKLGCNLSDILNIDKEKFVFIFKNRRSIYDKYDGLLQERMLFKLVEKGASLQDLAEIKPWQLVTLLAASEVIIALLEFIPPKEILSLDDLFDLDPKFGGKHILNAVKSGSSLNNAILEYLELVGLHRSIKSDGRGF